MTPIEKNPRAAGMSRRDFLAKGLSAAGLLSLQVLGGQVVRLPFGGGPTTVSAATGSGGADDFGALLPNNIHGLMLPPGFSSRIVARGNRPVGGSGFTWPIFPDGGACFATGDGGWIYAANSEQSNGNGGVSVIKFASDASIADGYSILTGTSRNCAGGPTPWGTWLSCEEVSNGRVFECDPFTPSQGVLRSALGTFNHEAAAVDPIHEHVYLTEDSSSGKFYRFTPTTYPDLSAGSLERAVIGDPNGDGPIVPGQIRPLTWSSSGGTVFKRGEGCWYEGGIVYFSTTTDNRVWAVDTANSTIEIIYDFATSGNPILTGADNVYASSAGDVYVAEDGGNMQIVALTACGDVKPVVQVVGHSGSEIAGVALCPDGQRMYFSSQRGPGPAGNVGVTFEVKGPFIPQPTAAPSLPGLSLKVAPNPLTDHSQILFTTRRAGSGSLRVHDLRGRRVRILAQQNLEAGEHAMAWDGRDAGGRRVPAGVYYLRLQVGYEVISEKVMVR